MWVEDVWVGLKPLYCMLNYWDKDALNTSCWKPDNEILKVYYEVNIQHGQELDPGQAAF